MANPSFAFWFIAYAFGQTIILPGKWRKAARKSAASPRIESASKGNHCCLPSDGPDSAESAQVEGLQGGGAAVSCDLTTLSRLVRAATGEPATAALANRVCQGCRELLYADGAAITLETSTPHRVTLGTTGRRADMLENLQDVLGEGPGLDAFDSGRPVRTGLDTAAAARWPRFVPAARGVIGSDGVLWSFPMRAGSQVIGAVTLYRVLRMPPGERVSEAQFLADVAAERLAQDPSAYRTVTESAGDDCWSSRAVVHQATGMLMAQLRVSMDEALGRLRRYAFSRGRQLSEVATEVVERRLDLTGSRRCQGS